MYVKTQTDGHNLKEGHSEVPIIGLINPTTPKINPIKYTALT